MKHIKQLVLFFTCAATLPIPAMIVDRCNWDYSDAWDSSDSDDDCTIISAPAPQHQQQTDQINPKEQSKSVRSKHIEMVPRYMVCNGRPCMSVEHAVPSFNNLIVDDTAEQQIPAAYLPVVHVPDSWVQKKYEHAYRPTIYNRNLPCGFITKLIPGMWGTPGYEAPEYPYKGELLWTDFAESNNPFFERLANASQEEKDYVLIVAADVPGASKSYRTRRRNMFAAVAAGGRASELLPDNGLVQQAALMEDHILVDWLLRKGNANVHELDCSHETPIMRTHTIATAQVLINYGALEDSKTRKALPGRVMWSDMDPLLTDIYRQEHKLDFWQPDDRPLDVLPWWSDQWIVAKAAFLFKGLDQVTAQHYLADRMWSDQKTIFERIAEKIKGASRFTKIKQLTALQHFLTKVKESGMPTCKLCEQPFDSKPVVVKNCEHVYHADCLQNHTTCPECNVSFQEIPFVYDLLMGR